MSPPPPASSTPVSIMRPSNSHTSIAHSMLNLSISPSSSSSSNNNIPFTSTSTPSPTGMWPLSPPTSSRNNQNHLPSPPNSSRRQQHYESNNEWKTSGTIPSLMGKIHFYVVFFLYLSLFNNLFVFRSTFKTYICYFCSRLYCHSLPYLSIDSTS